MPQVEGNGNSNTLIDCPQKKEGELLVMKIFNGAGLTGIGFFVLIFAAIVVSCFNVHAADYPTLVAVTPADQEVRVPIDTTIVIQFDKEMDTDSVENSLEVVDQFENQIQGTFSWSTTVLTNDTVTFTPTQNLDYSLSYGIEIGGEDAINHYPLNGYWEDVESYFATVGAPRRRFCSGSDNRVALSRAGGRRHQSHSSAFH